MVRDLPRVDEYTSLMPASESIFLDAGAATSTDADRRTGAGGCELDMAHHQIQTGARSDLDADGEAAGATGAEVDDMQRFAVRGHDPQDLAAGAIGHRPAGGDIVFCSQGLRYGRVIRGRWQGWLPSGGPVTVAQGMEAAIDQHQGALGVVDPGPQFHSCGGALSGVGRLRQRIATDIAPVLELAGR